MSLGIPIQLKIHKIGNDMQLKTGQKWLADPLVNQNFHLITHNCILKPVAHLLEI